MQEPQISFNGPQWFCIMVAPNSHRQVENALSAIGYRVFLPKLRRWVSHARVKKAVERPLLGRYMFVEVDYPRQSFAPLTATRGVDAVISSAGTPWPMPRAEVEDLLHRQMAGEFDEVAKGPIPVGARVAIVEGEFENWLATVTERVRGGKLSLRLLGGKVGLTGISSRSVRAASPFDLARSMHNEIVC
ncbi:MULTISPECIES: transcription termination/antitermination protein NusG [unclassified Bradyrhizobium]|uniref:transcription termination/antitermination protein NusG n=1 Tax=unclassified Bradyrhizobium TaxID=2631580 RepID=UPI0029163DE3|nr:MULTISPECIES: transcription termination/antitermination NusG family protein [unclassified Bradyrhizobium]